jgi:WD40 repeat protein
VDIHTGQERMHLPHSGQVVSSVPFFLADGQTLASEGPDGTVDLLRFSDSVKVKTLQSGSRLLGRRLIEFSDAGSPLFADPAGRWIADRGGYEPCYCGSGSIPSQYPLVVWDLARGTVKARLSQAAGDVKERHRLAATFDGDSIVMFYESGEITRWVFSNPRGREAVIAQVPVRPATGSLNWAADGSRLAFTSLYGGVEVYDTTGQLSQRFDSPLTAPALSPDGQSVALFDPHRHLELLYRVHDKKLLATFPAMPVSMGAAFSPDGKSLAYGMGNHVAVVEMASGHVVTLALSMVISPQQPLTLTRLEWSPDGQALVGIVKVGTSDEADRGMALLWMRQIEGMYVLKHWAVVPQVSNETWELVSFNPTGKRVALQVIGDDPAAQLGLIVYDLAQEQVIQIPGEYRLSVWLNDEDLLAVEVQPDTRLMRVNVVNGQKTLGVSVDAIALSPDGEYFAQVEQSSNQTDSSLTIREWQNGEVVAQRNGEAALVRDHAWSPNGQWLTAIGNNGTLRLWPVNER